MAAERRDRRIAEWIVVAQRSSVDIVVPVSVLAEEWRENQGTGVRVTTGSAQRARPGDIHIEPI